MTRRTAAESVTPERLAVERQRIRLRRQLAEQARRCWDSHQEAPAGRTYRMLLEVRCDQRHARDMPKLAEVHCTSRGLLFMSRIVWMPSDQINLRPWTRQHLEGPGMDQARFDLCMTDDRFLADLLLAHDRWSAGYDASTQGERWLRSAPPHVMLAMVRTDTGEAADVVGLWVRCKDHPAQAEALEPQELVRRVRHA